MIFNSTQRILKVYSTIRTTAGRTKIHLICKRRLAKCRSSLYYNLKHGNEDCRHRQDWFCVKPIDNCTMANHRRKYCHSIGHQRRTVGEMKRQLEETFSEKKISEPRESAEYLISHVIGEKTLHGIHPSKTLTSVQLSDLSELVNKRLTQMPIQYVLGEWDFRNVTLKMKPPVLIPRPETEELVEMILEQQQPTNCGTFLEVGPGSGPICLSLLRELPKAEWMCFNLDIDQSGEMKCVAVDKSSAACDLTRENAKSLDLLERIKILNVTLNEYVIDPEEKFDFFVSNPPYIKHKDIQSLDPEVKNFEDHVALDGGVEGMDVVRDILNIAPKVLRPGGSIWLEVDSDHPDMIRDAVLRDSVLMHSLEFVESFKDLNQLVRFCQLRRR